MNFSCDKYSCTTYAEKEQCLLACCPYIDELAAYPEGCEWFGGGGVITGTTAMYIANVSDSNTSLIFIISLIKLLNKFVLINLMVILLEIFKYCRCLRQSMKESK